jgi:hypothetical protein
VHRQPLQFRFAVETATAPVCAIPRGLLFLSFVAEEGSGSGRGPTSLPAKYANPTSPFASHEAAGGDDHAGQCAENSTGGWSWR